MLRMALCQDLQTAWPGLQVIHQSPNGEDALAQALALRPDLLFLDIRMPGLTGLEVAQALQEDLPADLPLPLTAFITAYGEHALQAFEQGAIDYVLKPWTPARLGQAVRQLKLRWEERCAWSARQASAPASTSPDQPGEPAWAAALAKLLQAQGLGPGPGPTEPPAERWRHLPVAVGDRTVMIDLDEVHWFEAADKHLRIVTADQSYWARLSLKELMPHLDPDAFWGIHRSHVVAVQAIHSAERTEDGRMRLRLKGRNECLPVSRSQQGRFKGF